MRLRGFVVLVTCGRALCGHPAIAQQALTLSNGDRLDGTLTRVTDSTWVFKYRGADLRIPTREVAGLTAAAAVGIRLRDDTEGVATIAAVPDTLLLLTFADGTQRTVSPLDVAAVGPADDLDALRPVRVGLFSPITRFWHASGGAGLSAKSGNSRARGIALSLDLERKTAKDRLSAGAALNRESSQQQGGPFATTVEKYFGYLRADVYLHPHVFVFGQTQQERDRFQDIALRSTYTAGLGVQAVASASTDFRFWASAGVRRERFISLGSESGTVAVFGYTFRQGVGPATLAWRLDATPSLQDVADYRFRSDASITTSIIGGIGLRVGAVNEFNNRPRPGVLQHDMLLTTTLTYSIGR